MSDHNLGRQGEAPGWQVLLIGGSSGFGKTVLAHSLARRCVAPILAISREVSDVD